MIIYQSVKSTFLEDVRGGQIEQIILSEFSRKLGRTTAPSEIQAWKNSLIYMLMVLGDDEIPSDAGITIECQIPQTAKRIDFIISGYDEHNEPQIVIIELKQWSSAELTGKDGIVRTVLGGGKRETSHPSYQAWSYATLLRDFSETVYTENISLWPCAFLHNYTEDEVIRNPFYSEYLEKAPVFLRTDAVKLQEFIRRFVRSGDRGKVMFRVSEGRIKPSKQLADSLTGLLRGNREFVLVDEQKLVYETALSLSMRAKQEGKKVLIVSGGPGTGKSVVAINLLVELTTREMLVQYVTKNTAPRAVYQSKLAGTLRKSRFDALFQGSGRFHDCPADSFDALIVDEAHRLNERSGMFQNLGENQVKEIIRTAACSIFFIDEDQRVTLKDIGSKEEIRKWANAADAECVEMELGSQFRCNGSDGYLAWIDNMLQIRDTANTDLSNVNYDFRVFDSPAGLRDAIFEKNQINNRARLVAGYCWEWISKKDTRKQDIAFPQFGFAMPWNFAEGSYLWSIKPNSVKEIGCIHTCQGLEMDYVGVIIGEDMIFRDGQVLVDPSKRARSDSSIKGYKTMLKKDPDRARSEIRALIKNTYRTLMTRGAKGCYVWCVDAALNEWVRANIGKP